MDKTAWLVISGIGLFLVGQFALLYHTRGMQGRMRRPRTPPHEPRQDRSAMSETPESSEDLRNRLRQETGPIGWEELQRHFARGAVLRVDASLDLLDAAEALVRDDRDAVAAYLEAGRLLRATTEHARDWAARQARFEAVVVAPWVLVREH
ncbi:DUF2288 domain-containing protein [Ectothiorhodospira mobilis]|uniref:DUF2288 domain-containing protein n=1 Tax=Ectothiorhodospira mobilis TaxID=195064 RepID=UPI0030841BE4